MPEENLAQPQVVTHHPFRWKKVILTVVVVLVVTSLIAAAIYWYTSREGDSSMPGTTTKQSTKSASKSSSATKSATKDQTTAWKTYTSNKGKYSIKYPSDWSVWSVGRGVDIDYFQVNSHNETQTTALEGKEPTAGFSVDVFTNTYKNPKTTGEKIVVGGVEGKLLRQSSSCSGGCLVVSVSKNGFNYEFVLSTNDLAKKLENKAKMDEFEEVFFDSVASFKFL